VIPDDPIEWILNLVAWDEAMKAERQRMRPVADAVPKRPTPPTDWAALAARVRQSGLRFTYYETTEDGVTAVTEPITVAVPDWNNPKKYGRPQ
jgi:hypothetical protein